MMIREYRIYDYVFQMIYIYTLTCNIVVYYYCTYYLYIFFGNQFQLPRRLPDVQITKIVVLYFFFVVYNNAISIFHIQKSFIVLVTIPGIIRLYYKQNYK